MSTLDLSRRDFFWGAGSGTIAAMAWGRLAGADEQRRVASSTASDSHAAVRLDPEAVFFPFDNVSVPFSNGLKLELVPGKRPGKRNPVVLTTGEPGEPDDKDVSYYGTIIQIDDTLHIWYEATSTLDGKYRGRRVCYATSRDGIHWEKPQLGIVEWQGSRDNNIVDVLGGEPRIAAHLILYDPEDPDPDRRYKMCFESGIYDNKLAVAFSADGLRWTEYPNNPVGPPLEPGGVIKFNGCYYVNGQDDFGGHGAHYGWTRKMVSFASYDFERWTQCSCLGFRRDNLSPRPEPTGWNQGEEVHLGAGLWNRGNVIIGVYGAWHGHPTGDRGLITMDLGLVISNDALRYREPIPDFKFIPAYEELGVPFGTPPRLMQGQGMVNVGEQTLYWYSSWATAGDVRLARWQRDRLGYFRKFESSTTRSPAHLITAVMQPPGGPIEVFLNVDGIGKHARVTVELLDERLVPIEGASGEQHGSVDQPGLRQLVSWPNESAVSNVTGPFRLRINLEGLTDNRVKLYAAYVRSGGTT